MKFFNWFRTWKRPWGYYEVLHDEPGFKTKFITIDPQQKISYQYHNKREEHWVVLSGQGIVTINARDQIVRPGAYIYVPQGAEHRMYNPHDEPLIFFELQLGESFEEEDIVRLDDQYGRVK